MRVAAAAVGCMVFGAMPAHGDSASKHIVTLADLLSLHGAAELQLSPEGGSVVYRETDGRIFIADTRIGGEARAIASGSMPTWSPDGHLLAYYSAAMAGSALQLWVYDLRTRKVRQITNFPCGIDPEHTAGYAEAARISWSPDGTRIAFGSRVDAHTFPVSARAAQSRGSCRPPSLRTDEPLVFTRTTHPGGVFAGFFPGWPFPPDPPARVSGIFLVDVRTLKIERLTPAGFGCATPSWSPDGHILVCSSAEGRPADGIGAAATNLYAYDLRSSTWTALTRGPGRKLLPQWSPDGTQIAYSGQRKAEIWGHSRIVVLSRDGKRRRELPVTRVRQFRWTADGRSLVVIRGDLDQEVDLVDVRTGSRRTLSDAREGSRLSWVSAARSGAIAWLESTGAVPLRIVLKPTPGSRPLDLYEFAPQVRTWALGRQETVTWRNGAGEKREGVLIEPADYHPGHRYPLIVDPYPGYGAGFNADPHYGNQAWASRGYAVFFPNPRLPWLWSEPDSPQVRARLEGAKGWRVTIDDILSGVDALVQRGMVDPNRMCLQGISNAGGVIDYLITRTHRFRCAVSVAPAAVDWPLNALLEDSAIRITAQAYGDETLWQNPEDYIRGSAVYHLASVATPTLLAVGDDDPIAALQSIEMYLGLRRLGKTVTFLRYPGQGHGFTGKAEEDFWRRENAFLSRYLDSGGAGVKDDPTS